MNEELGPGRTWQDVFSEISPEPVAAASLAQVCLVCSVVYMVVK